MVGAHRVHVPQQFLLFTIVKGENILAWVHKKISYTH